LLIATRASGFRQLFLNDFYNLRQPNWFHEDFISLKHNGSHGVLERGVTGEHERDSARMCMAHGASR
jgi:hypothetical protein